MKLWIGKQLIPETEQAELVSRLRKAMTDAGVHAGDAVICRADSQYGIIAEWQCCQETGAVPLFTAPDFPPENCRFLAYSDVRLCVSVSRGNEITVQSLHSSGPHLNLEPGSVIHMTSATSGNPKFILRTKQHLDLELARYIDRLQLTDADVILSTAPFYHAYAFLCPMLCSLYTGAALVQPDIMMPRNVVQLANEMRVTCMYGVPYFLDRMADVDTADQFADCMRYIVSSGEKLTEQTSVKFRQRFGIQLRQQFGCTELGTVTFSEEGEPYESQGCPISGVEFRIEESGGTGRLLVNTHGTMGYYITDAIRPIADPDGFFRSNDIGYFDADGRLFIEGRADDIIIRAGEKINLREIGAIIEKMPDVKGAALRIQDDVLKEIVCRYSADREIPPEEFRSYLCRYLSEYQIPNHYIRTAEAVGQRENWKHHKK